jgi:hypothetical protein
MRLLVEPVALKMVGAGSFETFVIYIRLHGVTSHNTVLFVVTVGITSNPDSQCIGYL